MNAPLRPAITSRAQVERWQDATGGTVATWRSAKGVNIELTLSERQEALLRAETWSEAWDAAARVVERFPDLVGVCSEED